MQGKILRLEKQLESEMLSMEYKRGLGGKCEKVHTHIADHPSINIIPGECPGIYSMLR